MEGNGQRGQTQEVAAEPDRPEWSQLKGGLITSRLFHSNEGTPGTRATLSFLTVEELPVPAPASVGHAKE